MNRSASGQLGAFRLSGSHWSFLPARKATVPSRLCSTSVPEYSKLQSVEIRGHITGY